MSRKQKKDFRSRESGGPPEEAAWSLGEKCCHSCESRKPSAPARAGNIAGSPLKAGEW